VAISTIENIDMATYNALSGYIGRKVMIEIVGRQLEQSILGEVLNSNEAEFVALYGRRRIGKTYLIKSYFTNAKPSIFFHMTGLKDGSVKAQLEIFGDTLRETFNINIANPTTWMKAFAMLTESTKQYSVNQKIIIFLDELPWMASPRSRLLQALDHFWNTKWLYNNNLKIIVCGSAASWMLDNIVNAKGGLHNRLTRRINLQPFTLIEAKEYLSYRGVKLNNDQILELYMAIGGVPHYLKEIKPGLSAQQIISKICFSHGSLLLTEYDNLLASLFKHSAIYEEILAILAKHPGGIDKKIIAQRATKSTLGGRLSKRLDELESAGFIKKFIPYGNTSKDSYYKLIDEYTIFYLKWIAPHRSDIDNMDDLIWEQLCLTSGYKSWSGYAFEALCYKHIKLIKKAMQLERISSKSGTWRYVPSRGSLNKGAQIDLIFDRIDKVMSLCEIKYTTDHFNFDKKVYQELQRKQAVFQEQTKCNKQIFWCMITTLPIKRNSYYDAIVLQNVAVSDLF